MKSPLRSSRALGRRALVLGFAMLSLSASAQPPPVSVIVTSQGPGTVRVRVASGTTLPCDSSQNAKLIDGRIAAGEVLRVGSTTDCVCHQHTVEPFVETDWSPSLVACRADLCRPNPRKGVRCPPREPVIRIAVHSRSGR